MIIEDGDSQMSYCADLVTLKALEEFPLTLLNGHQSGEWVQVKTLCQTCGIVTTGMRAELVTTWLPDPFGDQNYAVIIFYDDETKETLAAHYNKGRFSDANTVHRPEE